MENYRNKQLVSFKSVYFLELVSILPGLISKSRSRDTPEFLGLLTDAYHLPNSFSLGILLCSCYIAISYCLFPQFV